MKACIFALLTFSLASWAQPAEGPWVVMEADSSLIFRDVQVVIGGGITAKVFTLTDSTSPQLLLRRNFALDSHELLDSVLLEAAYDWPTQLWGAAIDSTGQWALVTKSDSTWLSYRLRLTSGTDSAWNAGQVYYGQTHWWDGDWLPAWGVDITVEPAVGGGWVVAWGAGEVSSWNHFWEFWITPSIAFISPEDTTVVHDQYSWMGIETLGITVESLAPDTAVLLCYHYGGLGNPDGLRIASISRQDQWVAQEAIAECASFAVATDMFSDHQFIALANFNGWNITRVILLDQSGICSVQSVADFPDQPSAIAWNRNYGYACIFVSPTSIQLARIDTSGLMPLEVGTAYWRDSTRVIVSGDVAIAGNGEVVMAWTERPVNDGGASSRVMLASVGWNSPLSSKPQPEVVGSPRNFDLAAYPNPFNNSVRISYDLPKAGEVELNIYDVLGRHVQTLLNQTVSAGTHSIVWTPDGTSGLYFIHLRAGHETRVQKLMFIK
jgi:hypothetical protein